jgi:hypothetical protein
MGNGLDFGVHNNSLNNLRRGLMERVFYVEDAQKNLKPAPQPIPGIFGKLSGIRRRLVRLAGNHTPVPREKYPSFYKGRRATIYQKALDSLHDRPVSKRDAELKTFVKAEKINFTAKKDPAPRVIQPRDPRYNIEVGKYLKPYEHHLYRAIDAMWGGPTVLKGYDVGELGNIMSNTWDKFRKTCAIGFDMKRFDQHVSVDALRWEHSVYNAGFNCPELAQLLTWQLTNKGVGRASDGFIKYQVEGCRMSGDVNTALGNCLLACSITKYLMKGIKCKLINNGDDCVLFFEAEDVDRVREKLHHWIDFGFQCIAEEPQYELEKVEFCQMSPIFDGEGWVMVRNPRVSLSKDSYSTTQWANEKDAARWLAAIGECGLAIAGGVPVLQSYYSCLKRNFGPLAGDYKKKMQDVSFDSGFYRLSKNGMRGSRTVSQDARYSFYRGFGYTPDEQEALEEYYDNLDLLCEWDPTGYKEELSDRWILNEFPTTL